MKHCSCSLVLPKAPGDANNAMMQVTYSLSSVFRTFLLFVLIAVFLLQCHSSFMHLLDPGIVSEQYEEFVKEAGI